MGRSFWILYDLTPLHEVSPRVVSSEAYLFKVKETYRLYARVPSSRQAPGPDAPRYPEPGANIDYHLAGELAGDIALEILDAEGSIVRAFSSQEGKNIEPEDIHKGAWPLEGVGTPRLSKTAGVHRFLWDLRYPGPWHETAARSGRSGPMVPPGTYQASLTVGDWSGTASIEVKMDPRVIEEGITAADVTAQAELALKVRDALSTARFAVARLNKVMKDTDEEDRDLADIKNQLITSSIRYSQPMLVDQLSYLYTNLNQADQRPGQDAYNRFRELNASLEKLVQRLNGILSEEGPSRRNVTLQKTRFVPEWELLFEHNEAPEWFRDVKFGIYFHWGVYSVPAFGSEWYPRNMHKKDSREYKHHLQTYGDPAEFGYHNFAPMFKAEHFSAEEWGELFKKAGARFAGPVAEHHDGFSRSGADQRVGGYAVVFKLAGFKLDISGL